MKNKEYVLSLIETIKDDEDFLANLVGQLISEDDEESKETIVVRHREHLLEIIRNSPDDADLNNLDISNITNMRCMFYESSFNGDISKWDTSNVTNMAYMFSESSFNGDISQWDTSNVININDMFEYSSFNGDVSQWDINLDYMTRYMRSNNQKTEYIRNIFKKSPLARKKPKWAKDYLKGINNG